MDYFSSDQLVEPKVGDLLISEPYLPDPNFERTVILICAHDENGTFGFVLNKQAQVGLQDVMDDAADLDTDLYVGGPVQQDTLHFLHRSETLKGGANQVSDGIYWGGNYKEIREGLNTRQLDQSDIKFFIGYSGWSEGQLMGELKQKSWIVFKQESLNFVFDTAPEQLWKHVLREMGGKFKLISNYPEDPRLN